MIDERGDFEAVLRGRVLCGFVVKPNWDLHL